MSLLQNNVAFKEAKELVPAPEGHEFHCNGCSKAIEYETDSCLSCGEPMGAYDWCIGDEPLLFRTDRPGIEAMVPIGMGK